MDGGQSVSFASYDSNNYAGNLTFHEAELTGSQWQLAKQSTIRHIPGRQVDLREHLDVVVLLQAAEIQRLTSSLHDYRLKFKRLSNSDKDYESFRNQADQLLHVKDQLELKNRKIYQYAQNQQGQIMDQSKYIQLLESKYKRALKIIENAHSENQELQGINAHLSQQAQAASLNLQAFKQKSIQQYQALREELEKAKGQEISAELLRISGERQRWSQLMKRQEGKFAAEREKFELLLEQDRSKLLIAGAEIERQRRQNEQYRQQIEKASHIFRDQQQKRQNQIRLLGAELERLSSIIKERSSQKANLQSQMSSISNKLTQKNEEVLNLRRQVQRLKSRDALYEQQLEKQNKQIGELMNNLSSLSHQMGQMRLSLEQKNVELRLRDNKIVQQNQLFAQKLQRLEQGYRKQLEDARSASNNSAKQRQILQREYAQAKEEILRTQAMHDIKSKQFQQRQAQLLSIIQQEGSRSKGLEEKYKSQMMKYSKQNDNLQKRLQELLSQKRKQQERLREQQKEQFQKAIRVHDQKRLQLSQKVKKLQSKLQQEEELRKNQQQAMMSLKLSLEKCEMEKNQLRKSKSFESMVKQMQTLCSSVIEKQGQIGSLKLSVKSLQAQLHKAVNEIQSLRQALLQLINSVNSNESSRREDNYLLMEQIKRLFFQQNSSIGEAKQLTNRLNFSFNRHKEYLQSSHHRLLSARDSQIDALKQRLAHSDKESNYRDDIRDIIAKIVAVTRENTELKIQGGKRKMQFDALLKQYEQLKRELVRCQQDFKESTREKDEACKRLIEQLQQSNSILFEQRQNQMRLQSSYIKIQEEQEAVTHQISQKQNIIKELRSLAEGKQSENTNLKQRLQILQRQLQTSKAELGKIFTGKQQIQQQLREKQSLVLRLQSDLHGQRQQFNQRQEQLQRQSQQSYSSFSQNSKQLQNQIGKMRNQISVLVAQNAQLRQEIVKTGNSIFAVSSENQRLKSQELWMKKQIEEGKEYRDKCQALRAKADQLSKIVRQIEAHSQQLQRSKKECDFLKEQLQKSQFSLKTQGQKVSILEREWQRSQAVISELQLRNNQLAGQNYELALAIQKKKLSQQKVSILSEEIDRLHKQKVNLIEELSISRFQISGECTLASQIKEHHILLVLLFAEIEALRDSLEKKGREVEEYRRMGLH